MIKDALKYLSMGLSVIPLKPRSKEPLVKWQEYQKRLATFEEVKKWWDAVPNANIGIVTGKISRIAVVDLDGEEGLKTASDMHLSSSIVSLTGSGKHLWYLYPNSTNVQNAVKVYPGIDIRGDGGYVVVPPSVSPNGRRYRWLNALSMNQLTSFPEKLNVQNVENKDSFSGGYKEEDWIAKALEGMRDGNIDTTLVSVLGRLRADGYTRSDARVLLEPHTIRVGAEKGHLDAKIENVWNRYEPKERSRIEINLRESQSDTSLIIHSPTNPDSIKQYEQRQLSLGCESSSQLYTGYPKFDQLLQGGLKSSRLLTVAALTSHGKTNFGIALSKNICEQNKSVLYFSTEYTYHKIWQRYIATLKNSERFKEHKFNVCDGFTPSIEQVEEAIIQIKPDVFVFDYIQHVSKEKEKLTDFMKGCQFLQRKYNNQGIILAQLNRSADWVENGKRVEPRLSMIEGSATIEQASSRVLLLSMVKTSPEYNEIDGYLLKNDDGDTGLVKFALYKNPYHIEEL